MAEREDLTRRQQVAKGSHGRPYNRARAPRPPCVVCQGTDIDIVPEIDADLLCTRHKAEHHERKK
jgi:hypothetical protein